VTSVVTSGILANQVLGGRQDGCTRKYNTATEKHKTIQKSKTSQSKFKRVTSKESSRDAASDC